MANSEIETTSMSSRGQVVIPQNVRERLGLREGEKFIVIGEDSTILLKKIEMPKKNKLMKELEKIAVEGRKRAEKLGIEEKDVPKIVHRVRGLK